ncbi:MAG TPA: hypothetical protein PLI95_14105, partial [Polyangiaceae bacterium]|nr:hypothetical protein [Polyangiaceae bacterium]
MNRLVVGVLKGLALAVVAAAMSGCCCGKRSLKGPISPSVAVPGNRLWSSAAVLWNTYESGSHTISSNCDHVLQLKGPSGERELSLSSWSPPNPGYHTCKNASYQLVVAPDGHGVAVSADGAKWQWIMLDAGDQPTLIKDGSFAASASDVLAKVPATSAFMRELLAKAERGESEAADVMRNPAFLHHLNGAIAWCCGPANDTVARTSLVRFAVSATGPGKKSRFGDTLTLELGDCVGDIAKSDPSLLPLLIAPLHDKPDASCSESP